MVKKDIKNKKSGFTLAEMMVSMLIVSVFFVAATKIISQKKPKEEQTQPHGFYECYKSGGQTYVHMIRGKAEVAYYTPADNHCKFEPPIGITFLNLHYLNTNNDQPYFNSQEPIFDYSIDLTEPADIESYYPQYFLDGNVDSNLFKDLDSFKNYLAQTHPQSKIYELLKQGSNPDVALFIAW